MTQYIIERDKKYRWRSYGHVAIVQPLSDYHGTDDGQIVRVKLLHIIERPKEDFFSKEMPVSVDELTLES